MARADSTIRVNIVGDSKGLSKELDKVDRGVSGIGKTARTAAAGLVALVGVNEAFDFGQRALEEADRLGDATDRLDEQLGPLAAHLKDTADEFSFIGASAQDMLELEARFADAGTAAGVADPLIAGMAESAAATAQALTLLGGLEGDQAIDLISKAALGAPKALKELGVSLTDREVELRAMADTGKDSADALTDADLAAAGMALVLEKLAPRVADINSGFTDLEQRQAGVQAKFETLQGKIGEGLEGPLSGLLDWILQGIDGWELFAAVLPQVEANIRGLLGPIAEVAQALDNLISAFRDLPSNIRIGNANPNNHSRGGQTAPVIIQTGRQSPDAEERSVVDALRDYRRRNGIL